MKCYKNSWCNWMTIDGCTQAHTAQHCQIVRLTYTIEQGTYKRGETVMSEEKRHKRSVTIYQALR